MESDDKVLGLVFDLTLGFYKGKRIVDICKNQFISYVKDEFYDEDKFYLYHPLITEPTNKVGEHISVIGNYDTDGWKIDIEYALKQTLYVVGAEDFDLPKAICIISNRKRNSFFYKKVIKLNEKDDYGCNFLHIFIGEEEMEDLKFEEFKSFNLKDPNTLCDFLKDKLKYE